MYIANLVFAFLFVYIFIKGFYNGKIGGGLLFGLIIGIAIAGVGMFNQYVVYPVTFQLVLQWFVYGLIQYIICGMVAALIYKE